MMRRFKPPLDQVGISIIRNPDKFVRSFTVSGIFIMKSLKRRKPVK
jgi:hypothetical protein